MGNGTEAQIKGKIAQLKAKWNQQQQERNKQASEKWAKRMRNAAEACRVLKNTSQGQTTHLADPDTGAITTNLEAMHDMIMKAWQPLFQLYANSEEPTWQAFADEYAEELQDWNAPCPQELALGALEKAVMDRGKQKAGGPDNWRTAEAQVLPSSSFLARQQTLQAVCEGQPWPEALQWCTMPLIPKNEKNLAAEQRPLTCFSVWHVSHDKAQFCASKGWLDQLMPWQMRGARPEGMTMDVIWLALLYLEEAQISQSPRAGYFLDREKCFDRLPWLILFALEGATGFPKKWSEADKRLNKALRSCFRLGSRVGPWWQGTNSFRQGAASSVRGVTLLMGVWIRRQVRILPRAFICNFFDDCMVIAADVDERQTSMNENDKMDALTGQRTGHAKTVGFSCPAEPTEVLKSRGQTLRIVDAEKALGVLVQVHGERNTTIQDKRVDTASKEIDRIKKLPINLDAKANLISLKTAGARYGIELTPPSKEAERHFDQKVLLALCGRKQLRCKATCLTLLWKGHLLFLEVATPYQMLTAAQRQLARAPWIRQMFQRIWQLRKDKGDWEGN